MTKLYISSVFLIKSYLLNSYKYANIFVLSLQINTPLFDFIADYLNSFLGLTLSSTFTLMFWFFWHGTNTLKSNYKVGNVDIEGSYRGIGTKYIWMHI